MKYLLMAAIYRIASDILMKGMRRVSAHIVGGSEWPKKPYRRLCTLFDSWLAFIDLILSHVIKKHRSEEIVFCTSDS